MSLNYVNLMDKYCYDEFIRTAPQPEVIPRSGEIQQLNITDEELRCITTACSGTRKSRVRKRY